MIPWKALSGHARVAVLHTTIDSPERADYILTMADNINSTFEHELKRLEKRVDALVNVCDRLQDENRSLKQRQDMLTSERANLLQKNEQVRARVEAMIGRLKAMEQGS
jgi:cell division protein ZapB